MKNTQAEKDAGLTPDEAALSPSDSAVKNADAAVNSTDAALNAVSATNSYKPEHTQPKSVITLEHVKRTYVMGETEVLALRDVYFDIKQGEFVTIMGPSGSGKSTCMNMIGCLDRPSGGTVRINGKETSLMDEKELAVLRNQTVGFVFQQYFLLPSMTVLENVMLPLRYAGIEKKERILLAEEALKKVHLADRMNHHPYELSGGQKQRAAIARATVTKPKIILADEPTGALDSETGKSVMKLFREINEQGTTVVIVTHDPRIGAASKRCIQILDGLIQSDTVQEPVPFDKAGK